MDVIEIFFSYAHEDESLMDAVRRQLVVFERNGRILKWHDRQIPGGVEWRNEIDERLNRAKIVLLFVSPHFIDSRYCYEVEGQAALRRHETGEGRVVPVILRPCLWQEAPFGKLQALPRDAKPLTQWRDRDEACVDVARGVMAIVDELAAGIPTITGPTVASAAGKSPNVRVTATVRPTMSVDILLISTGTRYTVEVPNNVMVRQLIPELLRVLQVSDRLASGQLVTFRLTSMALRRNLAEDLTIQQNGVPERDTLHLVGEFRAG